MNPSGFIEWKGRTLLSFEGADALDFLQRMSTNDMKLIEQGSVHTVLTTEKGRIVDVLAVLRAGGSLLGVGISKDPATTVAWLNKFIIMDEIKVVNVGGEYGHLVVPTAQSLPASLSATYSDIWGVHIVSPRTQMGAHKTTLLEHGFSEMSESDYDRWRIENGIPEWPLEINPDVNPLEANLDGYVSWTKGCYVGQEVIARLDTYKKLQKKLISISLSNNYSGQRNLYRGDTEVGVITSSTVGSAGEVSGMAFVKPAFAGRGTEFSVGQSDKSGPRAIVRG